MSSVLLNQIIPKCSAAFPDNIGLHDPEIMCHTTGMEVEPNVTAHRASPCTAIGLLLYGLCLVKSGVMWFVIGCVRLRVCVV